MSETSSRVQLEGVDWQAMLPFTHLFSAFRMALQPTKLVLAVALVVLIWLLGAGLDQIWGGQVYRHEFDAYAQRSPERFAQFLRLMDEDYAALAEDRRGQLAGVFETAVALETAAFRDLITAATRLDFGFVKTLRGGAAGNRSVCGSLWTMVATVPGWMLTAHRLYFVVFGAIAFALAVLFGGAISRLAALEACQGKRIAARVALRQTAASFHWYAIAPLLPVALLAAFGLLLALVGLALFNWPGLDILGGLLFGVWLLVGLIMAFLLVGLVAGGGLLLPCLAVEGTDAFDAVSRAYNYVLGRPWRYVFYTAITWVYGALTYLIVALLVFVTLWATRLSLGFGVFRDVAGQDGGEVNRLDAIQPATAFGNVFASPDWAALEGAGTATITAWLVMLWVKLLIALLPAYVISYFFSAQTWLYLLLRRAADGTAYGDLGVEAVLATAETPPEKVESP